MIQQVFFIYLFIYFFFFLFFLIFFFFFFAIGVKTELSETLEKSSRLIEYIYETADEL